MSWKPVLHALAAATVLLTHGAIAAGTMIYMRGIEWLIAALWGDHEPLLFRRMPLAYLFQAIDVVILLIFAFHGIIEANRAFKDNDE